MEYNKFQTQLTDEVINDLSKEVYAELLDLLENIPFIKTLVSKDRDYIKDRPWILDENGNPTNRREIDIINPHFLENVDYFRQPALYFKEHGVYTHLPKSPNPQSEYAQFWKEEKRKWEEGVTRPDGEWIPGDFYYYLNYGRIWKPKKVKGKKSKRVADFPNFYLGDYLFYHYLEKARTNGEHGKVLKARGRGISFKMSALSPRNMYVFPGSGNPNFHLASDKSYLTGDRGIWGKILDNLDWIAENTPLPRMRLVDKKSNMELQLGYENEYGERKGPLSSVQAISMKDNPDKARGVRGPLIHYEEDGNFPNLESSWNINREGVEEAGNAFGLQIAMGTGGVQGASFEGSEKLFYYPRGYNIHSIKNVFDKSVDHESECAFFWGSYLNDGVEHTKENGEPDVIASLIQTLKEFEKLAKNSKDNKALTQKKAEKAITPQDAVMRMADNLFPVLDIKEYLSDIKPKEKQFTSAHYVGDLIIRDGIVDWKPNSKTPIRKFPEDKNNREGAIEIFAPPVDASIPRGRYIGGIDPVDSDSGTSLTSIFIFDMFTDNIVAEYTGRPQFADEFYEICRRLSLYYNALLNYENKNKGLFGYFARKNSIHMLSDNLEFLKDQDLAAKKAVGNAKKGTNPTEYINSLGRNLQRDWLLTQYDEEKLNLHRVRSLGYLEELLKYGPEINTDRISAMNMVMLLREEMLRFKDTIKQHDSSKDLANDSFFTRNY